MERRADAKVNISPDNKVVISEGSVTTIVTHGMDIRGEMKENVRLDESSDVEKKDGVLRLNGGIMIK